MEPECNNQPSYSGGFSGEYQQYAGSVELDHGAILNGVRIRRKTVEYPCCPVCSCTVRHNELQAHLMKEMDNLNKLSMPSNKRKMSAGTPNSSSSGGSNGFSEDIDVTGATGSEVYERVKRNRERRLRAVSRRAQGVCPNNTSANSAFVVCPVCNKRIPADTAERHVDSCLRNEERNVDVENDVEDAMEEEEEGRGFGAWYSWGSEERVRAGALQLREGGDLPHGAMLVRRASTDTTLVVDGDEDTLLYGAPQYSPERIAPQEEELVQYSSNSQELPGYEEQAPSISENDAEDATTQTKMKSRASDCTMEYSTETIVSALKTRIRDLEQRLEYRNNDMKCLICMGCYTEPVVSVQCWHVHCETCWLESLRAKKTCPQCNAITTASHLRRIYI